MKLTRQQVLDLLSRAKAAGHLPSDGPTSLFVAQKRRKTRSARGRRDGFQNRRPPEPSAFFAPVRLFHFRNQRVAHR